MSFVLNKNINLKYIFGRKCPHPKLSFCQCKAEIFTFFHVILRASKDLAERKNKQDMRLTARCFDRLNMTRKNF